MTCPPTRAITPMMPRRLIRLAHFHLERWMQRGALNQILAMVAMIVSVAMLAGILVWAVMDGWSLPDSLWWAFLRLTDPGYLGDDEGAFLRTVSTVVTVLGYVLFMGSLIAIMTQWLRARLQKLERGLTPIALRGHILVLGWSTRTVAIIRELLLSEERVRRFLLGRRARRLRIVLMMEDLDAEQATNLRDQLGRHWDERKIILRSGTPLRSEHLRRVNAPAAAAIIIPGADFGGMGRETTDARSVKALLSISEEAAALGVRPPAVVAEVFNSNNAEIAARTYSGEVDVIASDAFLSRLIAQNVRHPGLSLVYSELLSYSAGNEVYVRRCPELRGRTFGSLGGVFPRGVLLGVVRLQGDRFVPLLNPPDGLAVAAEDRFVVIAGTHADSAPVVTAAAGPAGETVRGRKTRHPARSHSRILLLGWSRKSVSLLREFDDYEGESFTIDVASVVSAEKRERHVRRHAGALRSVSVTQVEADYAISTELERLDPLSYDAIVFMASDWLETGEESDARTVLACMLYRSLARDAARRPHVIVELMDPENARLFDPRDGEVIISPVVLSHMLAHVALRRELHVVFDELFGPGGAELSFEPVASFGVDGTTLPFREVQARVAEHGERALGIRSRPATDSTDRLVLNPGADTVVTLSEGDEIVVLTTYAVSEEALVVASDTA